MEPWMTPWLGYDEVARKGRIVEPEPVCETHAGPYCQGVCVTCLFNEIDRLNTVVAAARELVANIRDRYPDEGFYCPYMRKLDEALKNCF